MNLRELETELVSTAFPEFQNVFASVHKGIHRLNYNFQSGKQSALAAENSVHRKL